MPNGSQSSQLLLHHWASTLHMYSVHRASTLLHLHLHDAQGQLNVQQVRSSPAQQIRTPYHTMDSRGSLHCLRQLALATRVSCSLLCILSAAQDLNLAMSPYKSDVFPSSPAAGQLTWRGAECTDTSRLPTVLVRTSLLHRPEAPGTPFACVRGPNVLYHILLHSSTPNCMRFCNPDCSHYPTQKIQSAGCIS